jgi:hypothetical protein
MLFGDLHGVRHQHGNGQRPDAARHRRVRAGERLGIVGIDVARQFAVGLRFMPTSTMTAPGLIKVARDQMPALPMAATRMSARRHSSARFDVLEWQMVTVALACSNSRAMGFPTMSLRPTTTAWRPETGMS